MHKAWGLGLVGCDGVWVSRTRVCRRELYLGGDVRTNPPWHMLLAIFVSEPCVHPLNTENTYGNVSTGCRKN